MRINENAAIKRTFVTCTQVDESEVAKEIEYLLGNDATLQSIIKIDAES